VADDVSVSVELLAREPKVEKADHVTEASIVSPGRLAVLGCTDDARKAKTFAVGAGTWRIRATHTGLATREKVRLQLWPGKASKPRVLVRWKPPPPPAPKPLAARPKNRKQAVEHALRGKTGPALEVLLELHANGDASASASAAEILAFEGRWDEAAKCARALLRNPGAVYAGNVIDDMKAIVALRGKKPKPAKREPPDRKRFAEAVAMASTGKRFAGKPKELAAHCFALAVAFRVDDEIIARWDPKHPHLHFDQAADAARALVRKKDGARAWDVLASRLGRWYPVDAAQVLPMALVTDPLLAPLLTRERAKLVLATPRAGLSA
jgi:hypothetical protein